MTEQISRFRCVPLCGGKCISIQVWPGTSFKNGTRRPSKCFDLKRVI
jgi:hypothetical protein